MSLILVSPEVLAGSAAVDTAGSMTVGTATASAAPVMSAVMPPGIDPTSISAQVLVIGRTILALQMLAQFTGQRGIHGIVKDLSAGTYTAVEAMNAAAALVSG